MDDIRDITSGSNSDQNGGSTQQSTTPNQYSPYGQQGQYGQQRQYGQYGQTPDPQEDMFPTTPIKQKKLSEVLNIQEELNVFFIKNPEV